MVWESAKPVENPFDRLRLGTLLPWLIVCFLAAEGLGRAMAIMGWTIDASWIDLLETLGWYAALGAWIAWAIIHYRIDLRHLIGRTLSWRQGIYVAGVALTFYVFTQGMFFLVNYPLSLLWPPFIQEWVLDFQNGVVSEAHPGMVAAVGHTLDLLVGAPVVEEFLIRGLLLHRWAAQWGLRRAIVASSVLFALLHLDPIARLPVSMAFALVYLRTGSLLAPIVLHMLLNVVPDSGFGGTPVQTVAAFQASWPYGLTCLAISLPLVVHFFRHSWPAKGIVAPYLRNRQLVSSVATAEGCAT